MAGYAAPMEHKTGNPLVGDLWGGTAAMLVAVPSAIAFGVTIFAPLGGSFAGQGALAGLLGAAALGLVAASFGGAPRLISAPCAPAAALLAAFAIQATAAGSSPESIIVALSIIAFLCGVFQVGLGLLGIGRLIKYMPYPVVSGYMTGVGLIILLGQVPKFLGVAGTHSLVQVLGAPSAWSASAIIIGAATIAAVTLGPRLTTLVPAPVLGIAAGLAALLAVGFSDRSLLTLEHNSLVIGKLPVSPAGLADLMQARWTSITHLDASLIAQVFIPALTLAALLSIDTLKTCVVTDALTRSRHDSNRELVGQGCGNAAAALLGGAPGAGAMGTTMVNIASGGKTRRSGMIEGALSFAALLILAPLIAWIPIAALAGILIVVGARMIDWRSLHLVRSRSTVLDFLVIVSVVAVAETIGLIEASAVGAGLAGLLFIREQTRGNVVLRKSYAGQIHSKQVRLPEELDVLAREGEQAVIFELQGSLFFGTADQLYASLETELDKRRYMILDLRRVQSMDVTAAHILERVEDALAQKNAYLIFSHPPKQVPSGQDMSRYFGDVGLVKPERRALIFAHLHDALEWVENQVLHEAHIARHAERALEIAELGLFRGRKSETLAALEASMERRSLRDGEAIFRAGDPGEEIFFIRRGKVRAVLPMPNGQTHHLATFGRGDFFGEMSFLDREPRSAGAVAETETELYVLARSRFDALAREHRALAANLLEGVARTLAIRLRYSNRDLSLLQSS